MGQLIHELVYDSAARAPEALALRAAQAEHGYGALAAAIGAAAGGLRALGVERHDRVAVWLGQRVEAVHALFGAAACGAAMVPLDPACTPLQAAAILRDCGARVLVTSGARLHALAPVLARCPGLRVVLTCGASQGALAGLELASWDGCVAAGAAGAVPGIDTDVAALLYTHGEAGKPQGLVLSHRNLVAAAQSVARCLGIGPRDRLLAALPLSLDFGLNQLTSAFASGAAVVLGAPAHLHALPAAIERERATGFAALPSTLGELGQLDWTGSGSTLRYIASAGGGVPRAALDALRRALPAARIELMYGLTEAFRCTCLAPEQMERRPGSIGRPLPDAGVLVLRPDGHPCAPGEAGELVQRGALVALGYWNDPARTAERFKPLPPRPGLALRETALWTGDTVRMDEDGYLYPVAGGDDTIRTSGHRVHPSAVEEVVYGTGLVEEAAAIGVAHPVLGQVIAVLATARRGARLDSALLFGACRARLPGYMLPTMIDVRRAPLPRNRHGKIDRALLAGELAPLFAEAAP
jgi:acyl-CoA ligase (AMP-forming) (exosortase A-associated)